MSYRLINANAIVPSHPEVNDMPCIYADLENGLDGRLYDFREFRRIEEENSKLRELVLEIWRSCPVSEDDCAKCPHRIEESDEDWCDIPILMSELGIEVE